MYRTINLSEKNINNKNKANLPENKKGDNNIYSLFGNLMNNKGKNSENKNENKNEIKIFLKIAFNIVLIVHLWI